MCEECLRKAWGMLEACLKGIRGMEVECLRDCGAGPLGALQRVRASMTKLCKLHREFMMRGRRCGMSEGLGAGPQELV